MLLCLFSSDEISFFKFVHFNLIIVFFKFFIKFSIFILNFVFKILNILHSLSNYGFFILPLLFSFINLIIKFKYFNGLINQFDVVHGFGRVCCRFGVPFIWSRVWVFPWWFMCLIFIFVFFNDLHILFSSFTAILAGAEQILFVGGGLFQILR